MRYDEKQKIFGEKIKKKNMIRNEIYESLSMKIKRSLKIQVFFIYKDSIIK